jgi:hypothetical protein
MRRKTNGKSNVRICQKKVQRFIRFGRFIVLIDLLSARMFLPLKEFPGTLLSILLYC